MLTDAERRRFKHKHLVDQQHTFWHRPPKINFMWTAATIDTTLLICGWAAKNKLSFLCEAYIKGMHRRADIIIPELLEAQVIEIHDTEAILSIEHKLHDYTNTGLVMRSIDAKQQEIITILDEWLHNSGII